MISITRYTPEHAPAWDAFVRTAKNGLFLFERGFMDYHADRFTDHSLMVWDESELAALLPASQHGTELRSHGGLTFGGFVTGSDMRQTQMLEIFTALRAYAGSQGLTSLLYKAIPHSYHTLPAEEDAYALFREEAAMVKCEPTSSLHPASNPGFSSRRVRGLKKAHKASLTFQRSDNYGAFHTLLHEVLKERHEVLPVHSENEMTMLAARFTENIQLFTAEKYGVLMAGVWMFVSDRVAHAQYIAASPEGRDVGALDGLFHHLITDVFAAHPYFDFGISSEEMGAVLNEGLMTQKEEFGARSIMHTTYHLSFV